MKSLVVLLFLAGALHYFLHVQTAPAVICALVLWILWRLKYVILAIVGLEMLFGGGGGDNGGNSV